MTTPPGRSEVARTSPRDRAGSGDVSLATTTAVLPVAVVEAVPETRPRKEESWGARMLRHRCQTEQGCVAVLFRRNERNMRHLPG
ncbi:hypothetical protein Shyhy02_12630 [Streptomyces hygroscopicus subsp. hygroscopicus]|nr:hypothetical protein Shyhy02_12630 [Streptomyces hygroscopicus subsp. hygroscopicus]